MSEEGSCRPRPLCPWLVMTPTVSPGARITRRSLSSHDGHSGWLTKSNTLTTSRFEYRPTCRNAKSALLGKSAQEDEVALDMALAPWIRDRPTASTPEGSLT